MKGFIEITNTNGKIILINTNIISSVSVYSADKETRIYAGVEDQTHWSTSESYAKIKAKIESAC